MEPRQEQILGWMKPPERKRPRTRTAIGIAAAESSKGLVSVELDAQVLSGGGSYPEKTTIAQLPTTEYCEAGDRLVVSIFDVGGVGTPIVTGVYGGGDKMNARIEALGG